MRLVFLAGLVLFFAGVAMGAVDPGTDPVGFLTSLLAAIQGKQWAVVAGIIVMGIVWVVRTYGVKILPWVGTKMGGPITAIVIGILTDAATVVMTGGAVFDWRTIVDGLLLGIFSSGIYSQLKALFQSATPVKP